MVAPQRIQRNQPVQTIKRHCWFSDTSLSEGQLQQNPSPAWQTQVFIYYLGLVMTILSRAYQKYRAPWSVAAYQYVMPDLASV